MSDTWRDQLTPVQEPAAPTASWRDQLSPDGPTAQQKAVVGTQGVPDEAARSLTIAKQTGIPAPVVQSDLPGYDAHAKQQSAVKAVQNPAIAKYVNDNPMAASVSADDYDKLDEVSQTFYALHPEMIRKKTQAGLFGLIPEVAELTQTEAGKTKLTNALIGLPYGMAKGVYDFGKDLLEVAHNAASGKQDFNDLEQLDKAISLGIGLGLGRGKINAGRVEAPKLSGGTVSFDDFMHTLEGMKTRKEIDDFLASKQEGPPGAMLQITKAEQGAAALDKVVETAQDSKTKERSPETFAEFGAAHDAGSVHIDAAKVIELYQKEGKVPAEGDGLLGFVPGLAEKMTAAAATGGEISVPIGQYVAHIDPTVHEGLRESVRLHNDGVTLEEAKEKEKEIEAWHGSPHDFERFDLTKIGTGEGAQVYGHGLYFAENKRVGVDYFNQFVDRLGGVDAGKIRAMEARGETREAIVKTLEDRGNMYGEHTYDAYQKAKSQVQLYKVSINADPTHFLDWDSSIGDRERIIAEKLGIKIPEGEYTGQDFYNDVAAHIGSNGPGFTPDLKVTREAASKMLAEAGIPGIKYLDQGSRGKGDGTRNFVVFNDRLVKITEKNGNPIEALLEATAELEKLHLGLNTNVFMNMLLKDGKTVGITDTEFKSYSDKIARAEQAILDKAVAVHRAEVARALTPEWKREEAKLQTEVTQEFKEQGVFAAERYLRENKIELGGDRIEEIADGLAPLWGFESGDALRRALTELETTKAADRKSVWLQEREAIKAEVARRMEEQHGSLAENIAKEARQIALADHTFDVLADEVRLYAKLNGWTSQLSRTEMVDMAQKAFEAETIGDAANWTKHQRAVARGGREAEKALLKGDFQEAFLAKQRQFLAATQAKESVKLQGLVDSTEKRIDKFQSSEIVNGVDQTATEQFRQVLASIGLPQHFAPLADTPSLRDFVDLSEGQVAAAPWLMDGRQPKLADMTVEQFRALSDTLKSIEHAGRQALKLENAYGEAVLQNVVGDIVKELERFPFIDQPQHPSVTQRAQGVGRKVLGAHLLVERALDYTDKFNPHGPLTEWLDRPLRDANTKEITLIENTVRDLKALRQYVDKSINDPIENTLIPDALDKTGYLQMTRQNLRVLMLNMGNWSNIAKLSKGFGVNEADLRRFVAQHASPSDIAWVNGIWKIFEKLKPEADAVQLKDTGVPVDYIPAVPWELGGARKLNGGYYPLSYDPYNSDIQGRIARPLFDKGYFSASTPHGYTQERTEYAGAIDLSGDFLSSKIQGMIHDIAFRLPVRNANKLLENQEFRTAMAQHWGKEIADLLPGWLRDIANSHNLDDNYSKGFTKASSLIRQNIVSTLIAYNPGTFIKHGFTAAVMSADRVGLMSLLSSSKDIGLSGAAKSFVDLLKKSDQLPDEAFMQSFRDLLDQGKRGDNVRQFILDSSAVMRNRQRQADESIYGAMKDITEVGVTKTLADVRQRAMLLGRLVVAFSDQMSAMPTWWSAYRKAYEAGESHADAVFIADKEMSRAHGSNFVGDKPLVSRAGNTMSGEFVRWFTSLYGFFNHWANANFQLAWDAAAYTRGNPSGEPGANAARIAKWVGTTLAILWIEENAGPAKDEDGHGPLGSLAFAALRQFGAQFVGLRELTNGLGHGYEPSTGMIGTLSKAVVESAKDLGKATGVKAGLAKNAIKNTATSIGFLTGIGGAQVGRTAQFGAGLASGREQPRSPSTIVGFNDWRQGLRTGSTKARVHK